MKALVQHLLKYNLDKILNRSLLNCHVKGLHSIMLLESPGQTIRLYITSEDHELHTFTKERMPIAIHPHHCDLTLHCIKNWFFNIEIVEDSGGELKMAKWLYQSHIKDGEMVFSKIKDNDVLKTKYIREVTEYNGPVFMKAADLHTVSVPEGEVSAWLVYEGPEDPDYQPYCWSIVELNEINKTGLYQKPSESQILYHLSLAGLI